MYDESMMRAALQYKHCGDNEGAACRERGLQSSTNLDRCRHTCSAEAVAPNARCIWAHACEKLARELLHVLWAGTSGSFHAGNTLGAHLTHKERGHALSACVQMHSSAPQQHRITLAEHRPQLQRVIHHYAHTPTHAHTAVRGASAQPAEPRTPSRGLVRPPLPHLGCARPRAGRRCG